MATPMHFPMKLYELVDAGPPSIVAWSESGTSFLVNNSERFCSEVLPRHFRHSKMTSFQRQLNLYGFHRMSKGADAGRYQHALFMQGRPDLVAQIKREPRAQSARESSPPVAAGAAAAASALCATTSSLSSRFSGGHPSEAFGERAQAHPAFDVSMAMSDRKVAEMPGFDTENAALAMLNMSRSETHLNKGVAWGVSGGGAVSPASTGSTGSRKALSDSNVDAQMKIGAKLQQSLSRQSSLEAELTTLKNEMIGMNRTIEALARTVQMQQGNENGLQPQADDHEGTHSPTILAAEDHAGGEHQVKRRRSSESDVDLSVLHLSSPTLSSDGSEDLVLDRTESPVENSLGIVVETPGHGSECRPGPREKRRCESSSF